MNFLHVLFDGQNAFDVAKLFPRRSFIEPSVLLFTGKRNIKLFFSIRPAPLRKSIPIQPPRFIIGFEGLEGEGDGDSGLYV